VPGPSPIPFNRPLFLDAGIGGVRQAFANHHTSGNGEFTRRCQAFLQEQLQAPRALLTASCTDALEISALLLDLAPGDEFIVPAFTFVSTANAFALRGARPVFADCRADTLNLDETKLEVLITARTKAIVVVHYAGVGCAMDAILAIAARHGIPVIEDNAHGLFGRYRGRPLGSLGTVSTLSFHETKNLSCGEGGALVINDASMMARAEILRDKGTDRSRFFRGEVDKYTWIDLGSSFLLSDVLAALLWAQIEAWERIQARRAEIHARYANGLADWAKKHGVQLPFCPVECDSSHHLFWMLLPSPAAQRRLLKFVNGQGIGAVFHYQALNATPMGRKLGGQPGQCPVAEDSAERLVRLPFYFDLTADDQARVIDGVRRALD
jgi:dTDP-4-amino-4,6-dideoxygalactose transaminase